MRTLQIRYVTTPKDANIWGHIRGGLLLDLGDEAAGLTALAYQKGKVVTKAVNNVVFNAASKQGDVLNFYGEITSVGHTSMNVHIDVEAEHLLDAGEKFACEVVKVMSADYIYVAVDDNFNPVAVQHQLEGATPAQ